MLIMEQSGDSLEENGLYAYNGIEWRRTRMKRVEKNRSNADETVQRRAVCMLMKQSGEKPV